MADQTEEKTSRKSSPTKEDGAKKKALDGSSASAKPKSASAASSKGSSTTKPASRSGTSGALRPAEVKAASHAPAAKPPVSRPSPAGASRPATSPRPTQKTAAEKMTTARPAGASVGATRPRPTQPGATRPQGVQPASRPTPERAQPTSRPVAKVAPVGVKTLAAPTKEAPPPPPPPVELPATITVRDLAAKLNLTPIDIIKKLMANGVMANITQSIDFDTAALIAAELGFEVKEEKPAVEEEPTAILSSMPKKQEYTAEELARLQPRPPVVTVMGHVDHGKTSLLDAIRNTNVVSGEAGGITQHIGAYQIEYGGKRITFLDTPGHEAFTAMRARGAKATDIAIIVVAADDGVMPTTREAIEHARAAQVPIIIALNKIDRPTANPERVKQQLSEIGLEVYGGKDEVTVVPISAKQRVGIEDLLENILMISELADLRANPDKPAAGVVIESRLDKQQGPMATLLVQEGTLRVGDVILTGETYGKVRAMFNERGEAVDTAAPATPVAVSGLTDVPSAGDTFTVVAAEQIARARAAERIEARKAQAGKLPAISLNDLYHKFKEGSIKELNLIIKADVAGSLEPIVSSLEKLGSENLKVKVLRQGIGSVTQADVMLAAASQGIIIAFNVAVESAAETLAQQEQVDIRSYNIIYKLIEDVDKALKGMLEPEYKDVLSGRAQVLKVFTVRKNVVAGCRVIKGTITRAGNAKVLRDGKEIFSGSIASLRRFQDDVKEVAEGYECGIALEGFGDLAEGDIIESYRKERVS